MGKWKGSRGGRKKREDKAPAAGAEGADGVKKEAVWFNLGEPKASWTVEKKNALFEDYYRKVLGFDRTDGEAELEQDWQLLLETMRKDLPTTIRVTSSSPFEPLMTAKIVEFFRPGMAEAASHIEDEAFSFERIPWYPGGLAWQLSAGRKEMRKSPIFNRFRKFLVAQTENGNVSRQEAVSMLPPLFLDVKGHHWVLDMCASPGSKTAQMLETMHKDANSTNPTGVVVANDVDEKRCYMLVHQMKRLASPCGMVTNFPAQSFPRLTLTSNSSAGERDLAFDRILADVPCSGDGTLRKNIDLWRKWHPNLANGIHTLQLRIATRGAHLLKIGGRMVYSTCSLNPVENEAVVAALLNRAQGALELVDVSDQLPELKRRPGLTTWEVFDMNKPRKRNKAEEEAEIKWAPGWYSAHDALPSRSKKFIHASCFPPANAKDLHLERCVRVYPQDQNTGGFFVSVIQKVAEMPHGKPPAAAEGETEGKRKSNGDDEDDDDMQIVVDPQLKFLVKELVGKEMRGDTPADGAAAAGEGEEGEAAQDSSSSTRRSRGGKKWGKEEPFLPLTGVMLSEWQAAKEYYGVKDEFPESQLMVRAEAALSIYLVSDGVKDILFNCKDGLRRTINTGVAVLKKHAPPNIGCRYRPSQEGLSVLSPFMGKRIVKLTKDEFLLLVKQRSPPVTSFLEPTQQALGALDNGGCVFEVHLPELNHTVEVAAWKAGRCAQLFLNDQDKAAVLALLLTHEEDHPAVDAPSAATTDETETKDKDKVMEQ